MVADDFIAGPELLAYSDAGMGIEFDLLGGAHPRQYHYCESLWRGKFFFSSVAVS